MINSDNNIGGKFISGLSVPGSYICIIFMIVLAAAPSCAASDQADSSESMTSLTDDLSPYNFDEGGQIQGNIQESEAIAFLNEAVAYLRENGEEKAIAEFNNRTGQFVRGDLYIFGYDFNGTCIVHPIKPELIGQTGLYDVNGVDVVDRELALAKRGGGTMYIVFPNPTHEGKEELKQVYIANINASLYLGTGYFLSNISASFDQKEIDGLSAYVDDALGYARKNGKQKSLEAFNDLSGNFTRDGRYIFAYDYEGDVLALAFQPELIGTSRIEAEDPNGVEFIRQIIDVAEMGSGFTYYIYPDPSDNMTQKLKLSYVVDVDGSWLLGSGIYSQGGQESE